MNADWRRTTWGELIELKYGKALRDYKNGTGEYPVFGTNGAVGSCDKALCPFPGIIIGRKGAYRGVHFSDKPFFVIDTAYYVNPKADFNIKWAYYHLLHQDINNLDSGSAIPSTSREDVYQLPAFVPPRHFQDYMVRVLDSLNEKIQINRQINQTLEQLAQAIFKSWFVDFEPVKAKIAALEADGSEEDALLAAMQAISGTSLFDADASAAGAEAELARLQAEQPEQYAELRATAKLFPSAMQESELGEIPEGWTPTKLERYIELAYGKALKKDARVEGQYRVYGSGGVTGSHHEFLVPGPGIIVGRKGTVGSIYWEPDNFYPIDTTFYVTVKNGYSLAFAYYLLQTLGLSSMNTDAAVPGLNRNNVYRLQIPSFPTALVGQFSQIVASISEKISALNAESRTLTELRDSLLPKLLSGALTAPIAEELPVDEAEPANV